MTTDQWNPNQYNRFRDERMQPFFDLLAMIQPRDDMHVIDLGCGTGELTAQLAERLPNSVVEGIDASPAMLTQAAPRTHARLSFRQADVRSVTDFAGYDLVFSNAVFQWVPDNHTIFTNILRSMRPGAQIAIQVPKNEGHPSHYLAAELAQTAPHRERLGGFLRSNDALTLEAYATLLYQHGFRTMTCIEKIYGHVLARADDVVEWVKGTSLSAYLSRLDDAAGAEFLTEYRGRVRDAIGDGSPYFYPFRRLLFWGEKAG